MRSLAADGVPMMVVNYEIRQGPLEFMNGGVISESVRPRDREPRHERTRPSLSKVLDQPRFAKT